MTSKSRLPSPSLIVALLALVMACAGTATAASLISGKEIKKNTVTSKQIKNRTLRMKDLHGSATKALKGRKGDQGDPGAPGPVGPSDVYSARATAVKAADNTTMLSLNVPAGSYLATAKAMLVNNNGGASEFECRLAAGAVSDRSRTTLAGFSRDTVPFEFAYQSAVSSQITLSCNGSGISVEDRTISALRVGAVR
jgi:hypothetical protein